MERFISVGINYKKTVLDIRSRFSFTSETIKDIYVALRREQRSQLMILSTCNRTEIYAYGFSIEECKAVFRKHAIVDEMDIENHLVYREGKDAILHLFKVASGLESQIIGDYEIAGQIRSAIHLAKEKNMLSGLFQKILETSLQAGKAVRSQTNISDGTTSASYAVIQQLRKIEGTTFNICLIGWGKIGVAIYRNIRQHLPHAKVNILNRTTDKLAELQKEFALQINSLQNIQETLMHSNVVIVATAAEDAIISASLLKNTPVQFVFDLSVPANVDADVYALKQIKKFNIDDLSSEINQNLERRFLEVPCALLIIEKHIEQLSSWLDRKKMRTSAI